MSEKELTEENSMTQQDDYQTQNQTLREALMGLSQVQTPFQADEAMDNKLSQTTGFRQSIAQEVMKDNPDLTEEEVLDQMREMGY